jgi:hypothetical protein
MRCHLDIYLELAAYPIASPVSIRTGDLTDVYQLLAGFPS